MTRHDPGRAGCGTDMRWEDRMERSDGKIMKNWKMKREKGGSESSMRFGRWGRAALWMAVWAILCFAGCGRAESSAPETQAAPASAAEYSIPSSAVSTEPSVHETPAVVSTESSVHETPAVASTESSVPKASAAASVEPSVPETQPAISEDGNYTTREDVALYLETYDRLPDNFITKSEARALGWEGGSLEPYAPGMCIGGDKFGNYEGLLPKEEGRVYRECDIDTLGADSRGAKRIVYSNDGLIYYTGDHYASFTLLYE